MVDNTATKSNTGSMTTRMSTARVKSVVNTVTSVATRMIVSVGTSAVEVGVESMTSPTR